MAFLKYLIGPELIWIIAAVCAKALQNLQAAKAGQLNQWIEGYSVFLPIVLLALTMCLYAVPVVPKHLLLLRISIAAFIGTHFVIEPILNAHTEGGPGVGTIYMVAYILMIIAIPVAVVAKLIFIK